MTTSGRSSGRVESAQPDYLVEAANPAIKSADDVHPSGARHGRRRLAELRTQLSDRELAVLHSLADLKFATTKLIERLHFHGLGLTPQWAARGARETLAGLHDLGLIERLQRRIGGLRAGSASYVHRLTSAGARLIGHDNRRRSREPSLAHLAHVLAVAELVVRLHERARHQDVELLSIETEPACWRPFVGHHGARVLLKPDLRVTLGVGEHELHWFAEVDRGTEHRPALSRKITAYVTAWQDGGEETRAGVFPRVLWVVPDERRGDVIRGVWQSLSVVPEGMFLAAVTERAIEVLTSVGGLA
jgi:hypothetical protein